MTFGIRETAFERADAETIVANLIAQVTDAVASVFGEATRAVGPYRIAALHQLVEHLADSLE